MTHPRAVFVVGTAAPIFVSADDHSDCLALALGCDEVELGSGEKGEEGGEFHRNRGKCCAG